METVLGSWVMSLATVSFGIVLGAFVTVRRTKAQERWQAKYRTYQDVLSSVEDIRLWAEETYARALMLPPLAGEKREVSEERFSKAKRELWVVVHVGELLIAKPATERLKSLLEEIARAEFDFYDSLSGDDGFDQALATHADAVRRLVEEHRPEVVAAARADVGV